MRQDSDFRPFAFITLSGICHGLCIFALGMVPVAGIMMSQHDDAIEISEVAAPGEVVAAAPVIEQPAVVPAPTPMPAKPVVHAAPAPVKKAKALPAKAAPAEKVEVSEVKDEDAVVLAPDVSQADLQPIKDEAPVGVAAATEEAQEETAKETKEDLTSEEPKALAEPVAAAPVKVAAAAPVAASSIGTSEVPATPAPAASAPTRSYLELKQSPGNRAPQYPIEARRTGRQGSVEMMYYVTKEGKVTQAKILKSSGSKDLDAEALRTISQYKFVPGQEGWTKHPVVFSLKGQSEQLPARLRTADGN